ncbi:hypothetical protein HAX54_032600 [Datura stramonium]|uniref:Uncharacterized protein n=1 Tax=Datura stramonium TaxID=4076 RepID=A0ABS8SDK3_DATST|nr:hypothetical protein [Datura stramonium]
MKHSLEKALSIQGITILQKSIISLTRGLKYNFYKQKKKKKTKASSAQKAFEPQRIELAFFSSAGKQFEDMRMLDNYNMPLPCQDNMQTLLKLRLGRLPPQRVKMTLPMATSKMKFRAQDLSHL